jgi:polar amino acid transport system substrate-binding protein
MNKLLLGIIIFMLVCFGYMLFKNSCIKEDDYTKDTFIVGTAAGYAPFVSINATGAYEGFDIDIAQAVANAMGMQLEIKDLGSMTSLFMALDQGSIDAIIWGLSITQDRLKKVAMIRYQGDTTIAYPLIFWQKIPESVKSIDDMKGMTICVEPTSSQDVVLSKYSFIKKVPTEKVDDALLMIQYGKANAALVEPAIAKKFQQKYPEIMMLDLSLTPEDQVDGIGIAIKKDNTSLIEQVQRAVDAMQASGLIQQYEARWGIT